MQMQMLNVALPERSASNIVSILKSNNMPDRLPDGSGCDFNCWGFTAYYLGWEKDAFWMDACVMERHLRQRTHPISKAEVKAGDIAVFRRGESWLTHTAVVLPGGDVVCHKPGAAELCIDTVQAASESYGPVTYARELESSNRVLTSEP